MSGEGQVPDTPSLGRTGESGDAHQSGLEKERGSPGGLSRESASGLATILANKAVCVVVAHPDDETMWFGGLLALIKHPTVLCCSVPVRDPERLSRFFCACQVYDAHPNAIACKEVLGGKLDYLHLFKDMLAYYDVLITHNAEGEYGHQHHKDVHKWVLRNAMMRPVFCTTYGVADGLWMPEDAVNTKMKALACYDHKSPTDGGKTKAQALLDVYGPRYNLGHEAYVQVA